MRQTHASEVPEAQVSEHLSENWVTSGLSRDYDGDIATTIPTLIQRVSEGPAPQHASASSFPYCDHEQSLE
ncbi:MAG: hypothetical protein DHS20C03_14970 [Minwuia thermotolerans]|nr:MAG: hypothetical protein DHS20C03_14970 [Minwuia thermotolerans]